MIVLLTSEVIPAQKVKKFTFPGNDLDFHTNFTREKEVRSQRFGFSH